MESCERQNIKGEEFEIDRLKKIVIQNQKFNSEGIIKAIFQAADELVVKRNGRTMQPPW